MNILKTIILCAAFGLSIGKTTRTIETTSKPMALKKLQAEENSLKEQLLDLSDSKLHTKSIELVLKTAEVKTDKQAKENNEPETEKIPFGTTQYWKRQIAIATAAIEGLKDLLDRKSNPRLSPAKISKDLKNEHLRSLQESDTRNQSMES